MKLTQESHQAEEHKTGLPSSENLFDVTVLLNKMKSYPDLFKAITPANEPKIEQTLQRLPENKRMQYILEELTLIPSVFEFPKMNEKALLRYAQIAIKTIEGRANKSAINTVDGEQALLNLRNEIGFLAEWLSAPIIYDKRKESDAHNQRRSWRKKMVSIFDIGEERSAEGPFTKTYMDNKLSSNFSSNIFSTTLIFLQLPILGLQNLHAQASATYLKEIAQEFHSIPAD